MKKIILNLLLLLSTKSFSAIYEPCKLDAKILQSIDGVVNLGIDGTAVAAQYQVLGEIYNLQFGKTDANKKRVPILTYKDKKVNLKRLVIEEGKLVKMLKEAEIKISLADIYHNPKLAGKYESDVRDLKKTFEEAKKHFRSETFQFLDSIQHFKAPVVALMAEFAQKRNRKDTILLKWADVKGNEEEALNKSIKTILDMDKFLSDLGMFLKDLMHNCPKARKQFEEWYKKN